MVLDGAQLRAILEVFRDLVTLHAATLNRLNVFPVPDGDTGTNMARTLDAIVEGVSAAGPTVVDVSDAAGRSALLGARGNSGIILAQLLRGMLGRLRAGDALGPALEAGAAMARAAVLQPAPGTMLTVADDAAAAAVAADGDVGAVLEAARLAAEHAVARTPDLLPVLKEAGVVDAGGAGLALFFDAALHVVNGRALPTELGYACAPTTAAAHESMSHEVMFVVAAPVAAIDALKATWAEIGDSVVVIGDESGWSCHVHTNDAGAVLDAARQVGGEPTHVRVETLDTAP